MTSVKESMENNRRTFLIQSGATFGVIGLGYLLWDSPGPPEVPGDAQKPPTVKPPTGLLGEALARMKAENKPGVAIRIPVDPETRHLPGHFIVGTLNQPEEGVIRLYAQSVFVCLESAVVQGRLRGADPSHNLVLFDATLRVVAGIDFKYDRWDGFAPALLGLVQGKEDALLKSRAESIRRSAPAPVVDAVDRLDSVGDRTTVAAHAAKIAPLLVYEDLQPTNEIRKKALTDILRGYVESSSATVPGPRLPFGVETSGEVGGCGDSCRERSESQQKVVVGCGMGRVSPTARSFARYLSS